MKKRFGFVSNSSSSSFIITIGKVINKDKFNTFIESIDDKFEELIVMKNSEFLKKSNRWPDWECGDWAGYGGGGSVIKKIFKDDPVATVFVKTGTGPDGDHCFEDDGWGCDYSKIDIEDFDPNDIKFYESGKEQGVEIIESFYGAGRNG